MERKKAWNIVKLMLKFLFTGLGLYIVYKAIELDTIKNIWKAANLWWALPAILCFLLSQLISSFRLLRFFKNIALPVTSKYNIRLFIMGMFYNLFLPGGIGGDGYKILALHNKFTTKYKVIFGAVFFDRLSGLWALGFITCLFLPFVQLLEHQYITFILAAFVIGSFVYVWVVRRYFNIHFKSMLYTHALAIGVQSFQVICASFILLMLGQYVGHIPYLTIFLLSALATLFPFTVGGLGAREVAVVYGASIMGLNKDLSVSVSLCFYIMAAVISLIGGVLMLFTEKKVK